MSLEDKVDLDVSCWRDLADALDSGIDRVILYGPPGTGKTFAALNFRVRRGAERIVCTEDLTSGDVMGCWVPVGEGRWEWSEGPAVRAWRRGHRLVVDEVDRASGDVLSLLLAVSDSEESASVRHPGLDEVVVPHRDFSVIMTTNVTDPDDIPEALLDRFPVRIRVDRPHPDAVQGLSSDLQPLALNASVADSARRLSLRTFYAFDRIRQRLGDPRAAELVLGPDRAEAFLDALSIAKGLR
jgi:MoxR-like ATPase